MPEPVNQPLLAERLHTPPSPLVRAHFPAHQGRLTEVTGLCGEHLPQDVPYLRRGTLREAEARLAERLGVRASLLLTNGASQGLLAACLALARRARRVAIAGDCHVAVSRGLVLADLIPVPIPSRRPSPDTGDVLAFLAGDPPLAMILPSPSYRGERLDLAAIARRCQALGIDLMVDEVHGSQLRGLPLTAEGGGESAGSALDLPCALVLHSAHKYAGALVQGAVLHLPHGSRLELDEVRAALDLIDTTSRSNLIQASVEAALYAGLPGGALHDAMLALTQRVAGLATELDAAADPALARDPACLDPRKLVLRSDRGHGLELARRLLNAGLDHEYANVDEVLLVFSPAHDAQDFARAGLYHIGGRRCRMDRSAELWAGHGAPDGTDPDAIYATVVAETLATLDADELHALFRAARLPERLQALDRLAFTDLFERRLDPRGFAIVGHATGMHHYRRVSALAGLIDTLNWGEGPFTTLVDGMEGLPRALAARLRGPVLTGCPTARRHAALHWPGVGAGSWTTASPAVPAAPICRFSSAGILATTPAPADPASRLGASARRRHRRRQLPSSPATAGSAPPRPSPICPLPSAMPPCCATSNGCIRASARISTPMPSSWSSTSRWSRPRAIRPGRRCSPSRGRGAIASTRRPGGRPVAPPAWWSACCPPASAPRSAASPAMPRRPPTCWRRPATT